MELRHDSDKNATRILVVDDEPRVTSFLEVFFANAGNFCARGENVSLRAVATAEEFRPDLILLDIDMPTLDGGKVAKQLKEHPVLGSVPIIFVSGVFNKAEVQKNHGMLGGFRCIAKPLCGNDILKR